MLYLLENGYFHYGISPLKKKKGDAIKIFFFFFCYLTRQRHKANTPSGTEELGMFVLRIHESVIKIGN